MTFQSIHAWFLASSRASLRWIRFSFQPGRRPARWLAWGQTLNSAANLRPYQSTASAAILTVWQTVNATLRRREGGGQMAKFDPMRFDLVILDECHESPREYRGRIKQTSMAPDFHFKFPSVCIEYFVVATISDILV